jgi:hypothetical protein
MHFENILDIMNLEIIIKTGEPKDVRNAKRISVPIGASFYFVKQIFIFFYTYKYIATC